MATIFVMQVERVPFSSVVGQSLTITHPDFGVVAQLSVRVPQPHLDYRTVAEAVATALTNSGVVKSKVTLVLPEDFPGEGEQS